MKKSLHYRHNASKELTIMERNLKEQLLKASQQGDMKLLERVIDKWKGVNTTWANCQLNKSCDTVVHLSVRHGHADVVKYLCNSSFTLEQQNCHGKRPIHEAAQFGQTECLRLLLEKGVKVDSLKRADWYVDKGIKGVN